jgi:hypothetical protein
MRRRAAMTLVAGVSLAASIAHAAPAPTARVTVDAGFDRRSILPGQVAVMEVHVRNLGPDTARGLVVETRLTGAPLVRARSISGRCSRVSGALARCSLAPLAPRTGARIVVVARGETAGARLLGSAWIVRRSTDDPSEAVDLDTARSRVVAHPVSDSYAELSFVLEAPSTVVAGRPFRAVLRLLNRGPAAVNVGQVRITPAPEARTVLSAIPARLAAGQERAVVARITPARAGPLRLNVRVGRSANHVARLFVRE